MLGTVTVTVTVMENKACSGECIRIFQQMRRKIITGYTGMAELNSQ
jgi:hypothetical protein